MANRIAIATGNYTSTTTWGTGTNSPTIHATTNITITGTPVGATFTAPSTTDASRGVVVWLTSKGSATSFTATLQEDLLGTSTWLDTAATATITLANVSILSFIYFQWAAYTFATTGANRYRIKITSNNNTGTLGADSGGANFAYMHVDNRSSAAPAVGASDQIWVVGNNNATPLVTVTIDGTSNTCGNGTNNNNQTRVWTNSVNVSAGAILKHNTAASSTLVITGSTQIYPGGIYQAQPAAKASLATFQHAAAGSGQLTFYVQDGGTVTVTGYTLDVWKTTYVSGTGTAASPLVIADASADWAVGDQIFVFADDDGATNYNNCESRYIITKNSNTSYVLSSTAGGAETALTATHTTDARVVNVTRNVVFGSSTANNMGSHAFVAQTGSNTNVITWARFSKAGTSGAGNAVSYNAGTSINYSVVDAYERTGFRPPANATTETYTGLIAFGGTSGVVSGTAGIVITQAKNKTLVDCMGFNSQGAAFSFDTSYVCTLNNCVTNAVNKANTTGWSVETIVSVGITFNNYENNACRGFTHRISGSSNIVFNNGLFGTKGTNGNADISSSSSTFNTATYNSLQTAQASQIATYTTMLSGSELRFDTLNGTANNHIWYTPDGINRSSGASLTDTTNRTAGNLTVRMAPENSTGTYHQYQLSAKANTNVIASGFVRMNAAFQGNANTVLTASLYLPGTDTSGVPDDTVTITKTANTWLSYTLGANYTGSIDRLATVIVKAINPDATASAYAYHTDILNGTNTFTGLRTWDGGKPSLIMFEQLGDAQAAAQAVIDAGVLTVGKFLALK